MVPQIYTLAAFLAIVSTTFASPCKVIETRREWRELSITQQRHFLEALACARKLPSALPKHVGSLNRYDDFVYAHYNVRASSSDPNVNSQAHGSSSFLPWHRLYLAAFEKILKDDCHYTHQIPYWDWTLDAQAPEKSIIWSDGRTSFTKRTIGFGADGNYSAKHNTNCLTSGPFSGWQNTFPQPGCLERDFSHRVNDNDVRMKTLSSFITPEGIAKLINDSPTYSEFRHNIETTVHGAVHQAVGGTMSVIAASSNDPIFWLHHANIDRLWSVWQARYMEKNPNRPIPYDGLLADKKTRAYKYDRLELSGMYPALDKLAQVGRMLDTQSGHPLCYRYTNSVRAQQNTESTFYPVNMRTISPSKKRILMKLFASKDKYTFGARHNITPTENDRGDQKRLRCASRLTNHTISQMAHTQREVASILHNEQRACCFINYIELMHPEYTSPSALGIVQGKDEFYPVSDEQAEEESQVMDSLYLEFVGAEKWFSQRH